MITIIGRLTNAALGWALPGLAPSILYLVAGLMAVGIPSAYAWHKGSEGKAAAIVAERANCEIGKAEDARLSAESLAHVLATIKAGDTEAADAEPRTKADLKAACAKSKLCRKAAK